MTTTIQPQQAGGRGRFAGDGGKPAWTWCLKCQGLVVGKRCTGACAKSPRLSVLLGAARVAAVHRGPT